MGFNYGLEKRKFTEEWKKLYREYKAAGMSEEDIQDIYAFDLNVFRKNRTEFQRTQPLSESSCDDGAEQGESMSALLNDYSGPLAHPGRSLAQLDRASAHSTRSAVQPMLAADQHTC